MQKFKRIDFLRLLLLFLFLSPALAVANQPKRKSDDELDDDAWFAPSSSNELATVHNRLPGDPVRPSQHCSFDVMQEPLDLDFTTTDIHQVAKNIDLHFLALVKEWANDCGLVPENLLIRRGQGLVFKGNGKQYDGKTYGVGKKGTATACTQEVGAGIATRELVSFGRISVRAKVAPGAASAFWTSNYIKYGEGEPGYNNCDKQFGHLTTPDGYTYCTYKDEIDGPELSVTGQGEHKEQVSFHTYQSETRESSAYVDKRVYDGKWHTYTYYSTPRLVSFYLDGEQVAVIDDVVPQNPGRFNLAYFFPKWGGDGDFATREMIVSHISIWPDYPVKNVNEQFKDYETCKTLEDIKFVQSTTEELQEITALSREDVYQENVEPDSVPPPPFLASADSASVSFNVQQKPLTLYFDESINAARGDLVKHFVGSAALFYDHLCPLPQYITIKENTGLLLNAHGSEKEGFIFEESEYGSRDCSQVMRKDIKGTGSVLFSRNDFSNGIYVFKVRFAEGVETTFEIGNYIEIDESSPGYEVCDKKYGHSGDKSSGFYCTYSDKISMTFSSQSKNSAVYSTQVSETRVAEKSANPNIFDGYDHNVAMNWSGGKVVFSVDGVEFATLDEYVPTHPGRMSILTGVSNDGPNKFLKRHIILREMSYMPADELAPKLAKQDQDMAAVKYLEELSFPEPSSNHLFAKVLFLILGGLMLTGAALIALFVRDPATFRTVWGAISKLIGRVEKVIELEEGKNPNSSAVKEDTPLLSSKDDLTIELDKEVSKSSSPVVIGDSVPPKDDDDGERIFELVDSSIVITLAEAPVVAQKEADSSAPVVIDVYEHDDVSDKEEGNSRQSSPSTLFKFFPIARESDDEGSQSENSSTGKHSPVFFAPVPVASAPSLTPPPNPKNNPAWVEPKDNEYEKTALHIYGVTPK